MSRDPQPTETTVLIAGAGPSGLTLALDLGQRGIRCHVIEAEVVKPVNPRCNTTSARSMEHFRRLGVADAVRRAGLPEDYPTTVQYRTSMTGHDLFRMEFPSSAEVLAGKGRESWPTPEPQHRISQLFLEPVLAEKAAAVPGVTIEHGARLVSIEQSDDEAIATVETAGGTRTIHAKYIAGCDGGHSVARHVIGTKLSGTSEIRQFVSTFLRSSEIGEIAAKDRAWTYWTYGEHFGALLAINGSDLWLNHISFSPDHDTSGEDAEALLYETIGREVEHEVIGTVRWTGRQLVADRYRDRRVFLVGDAAHLWIPVGGFGMNAGIQDATALAWMIAAVEEGWASPAILDAYELERKPIGEQFSRAVARTADVSFGVQLTPELYLDGPEGEAARAALASKLSETERGRYNPEGFSFGYHYVGSPLVAGGEASAIGMSGYPETAQPGFRLPHLWLEDGSALFDRLGAGFTLLRVGGGDSTALEVAAARRGLPLTVVDLPAAHLTTYPAALILVRPDQHVAWMGEHLDAPDDLLDLITGRVL